MIRFDCITLFPEMFEAVTAWGITQRALDKGLWSLGLWNPRDFANDNYRTVDDRPYGGGPGMVMTPQPWIRALEAVRAERGVPGAEKTRHVAEFKTHNAKSFADLVKNGVEKSKPEHFAQMQVYMLGTEIDRALYVAVCKDNDEIYTERVELNREFAEKAVERGKRIALADRMPEPISADPSWFVCKFCDAHAFCHDKQPTKHVNCRTCAHSTAMEDSTWRCERHDADDIPLDFQRKGCDDHVLHPDLVPWRMEPHGDDGKNVVYWIENNPVVNGPDGRTSREILENPTKCAVAAITAAILKEYPTAG